jgi:hypothetical protein
MMVARQPARAMGRRVGVDAALSNWLDRPPHHFPRRTPPFFPPPIVRGRVSERRREGRTLLYTWLPRISHPSCFLLSTRFISRLAFPLAFLFFLLPWTPSIPKFNPASPDTSSHSFWAAASRSSAIHSSPSSSTLTPILSGRTSPPKYRTSSPDIQHHVCRRIHPHSFIPPSFFFPRGNSFPARSYSN